MCVSCGNCYGSLFWAERNRVLNAVACDELPCALRAPTAISVRIKTIRTEIAVIVKSKVNAGFHTRSSIAHGWLFIRAQSTIRADDFSSAPQL